MESSNKIIYFEYFLYRIVNWYKRCYPGGELVITRLKALKLLFLASAVKTKDGDDLLDIFDKFYAMQHGPVEGDIYNAINSGRLSHYGFGEINITIINDENIISEISDSIRNRIDASISALYEKNPLLIQMPSFKLVDITHKWDCWQKSMEAAKILGKGSYLMNVTAIRESCQVFE